MNAYRTRKRVVVASYPEDIPDLTRPVHSDPAADDSPTDATVIVDAISDEIEAIATELGTTPSGQYETVADRLSGIESIDWTGPTGLGYDGITSTTELTPEHGTISLEINKKGALEVGSAIRLTSQADPTNVWINGIITAFQGLSLTLLVTEARGDVATSSWYVGASGGVDGKSAYEVAVAEGYGGTEEEWLASLQGEPGSTGSPGDSAYQVALNNGYSGTEEQWLASLEGPQGDPGEDGIAVESYYLNITEPLSTLPVDSTPSYLLSKTLSVQTEGDGTITTSIPSFEVSDSYTLVKKFRRTVGASYIPAGKWSVSLYLRAPLGAQFTTAFLVNLSNSAGYGISPYEITSGFTEVSFTGTGNWEKIDLEADGIAVNCPADGWITYAVQVAQLVGSTGPSISVDSAWQVSDKYPMLTGPFITSSAVNGTNGEDFNFEVSSQYRAGTGQVLKFDDPSHQSIIAAPDATDTYPTAQRLVVQGPNGFLNSDGEGGDVYLWAGNGAADNGSGGDIKADGGQGAGIGQGGTVKIRGGYSPSGDGGFVQISSGSSTNGNGGSVSINSGYSDYQYGGDINIYAASGEVAAGNISISTGSSLGDGGDIGLYAGTSTNADGGTITISAGDTVGGSGGDIQLQTFTSGQVILTGDGGEFLNNADNPDNQIATLGDIGNPVGFTFLGEYTDAVNYAVNDVVSYEGSSYVCISPVTANTQIVPDVEPSYWSVIAVKGSDGAPGAPGNDGVGTRYFGAFASTQIQTVATINTATAVTFDTTEIGTHGVALGTPTSRVVLDHYGVYNVQFSAQLDRTNSGTDTIDIWLRLNGENVPRSNTQVTLVGNNAKAVAAWNFLIETAVEGDYIELMWSSPDTHVRLYAQGTQSTPTRPAIPSVILTVVPA